MTKFLSFLQKIDTDVEKALAMVSAAAPVLALLPGGVEINAAAAAISAVAQKL